MTETASQYVERLLGYVGEAQPLQILEQTIDRIDKLVSGSQPDDLRRRPSAEGWSAAQILAHLCDSELVFGYRARMIASVTEIPIQAYDQNDWINNESSLIQHPEKAIQYLKYLREMNIRFLKSLPEQKWNNFGIHAERGKESIHDLVRLYAGHDRNHLMQIEMLLSRK